MGSASTQFSKLLQQARISSFDPAIPQLYTAPKAYIARGEWGMKRPLPSTPSSSSTPHLGMLRYVEVSKLDTLDRQVEWKEREKEALFVKRWAETNAKLHLDSPDQGSSSYAEPGRNGPRPTSSFLRSTQRYFPADIPGPITLTAAEEAREEPNAKEARLYNNKWRQVMQYHAARGAADPAYKGLDFKGEHTPSTTFGHDAEKYTTRPRMTTNYNSLSEKDFDKFIDRIRAKRSAWKKYYMEKEASRQLDVERSRFQKQYDLAVAARKDAANRGAPLEPLPEFNEKTAPIAFDMLEQSRTPDATKDAFFVLEEQVLEKAAKPTSIDLPGTSQASTMHPHAGLQYAQPDAIYTNVLSEPVPGRVIHEVSSKSQRDVRRFTKTSDGRSVLVGGRVSYLRAPLRSQAPPTIDWSRQDLKQGTGLFRVLDAYRTSSIFQNTSSYTGAHKDMLTPRNDLGYIKSNLQLIKTDNEGKILDRNPAPGSPEYIGQKPKDLHRPIRRAPASFAYRRHDDGAANTDTNAESNPFASLLSVGERRRADNRKRERRLGRADSHQSDAQTNSKDSTRQMFDNLENIVNPRS